MALNRRAIDVLIVDDDRDLSDTIAETLSSESYTVAIVEDGVDALEFLERNPAPRMMMLDLFMPRMGGIELMSYQQGSKWQDTQIVIVSALERMNIPKKWQGYVIKKPFSLVDILTIAHNVIRNK